MHPATVHSDAKGVQQVDNAIYTGINPVDGQFHTYGFLWEKTGIKWYVDGVQTLAQSNRVDIPMYVLIDLAVGNDPLSRWPGTPNASTHFPANMDVDYFRVYSNDPALPSVTPEAGYQASSLPKGLDVVTTSTTGPMPSGWSAGDVGTSAIKGASSWSPTTGEWILKSAGTGNQCEFAGTPLAGDGTVTATLQSMTRIGGQDDRAGVGMRSTTQSNSPEISVVYATAADGKSAPRIVMNVYANGIRTAVASVTVTSAPVTLRLQRQGNLFTGSYSTDAGLTWTPVGSTQNTTLVGSVQAGILVGNPNGIYRWTRGIFTGVSVTN